MANDELHTIETLKKYRGLMSDLIHQHSGRVVDNPGDNLLAEFSSAVDAVGCAVQIQERLKKENAKFVEDKRLKFRIGINIGDVVHEDDRIYGSGVNVAARIEGLANPGGICISRNAYDHVKDKIDLGYEYLGEHEVKNIKGPVRVYKVLLGSDLSKPLVEEKLELPNKPSIAVLPFNNMSGVPDQEYFSDGLTEQIINGLCKVKDLFVIARNSSFAYKGKSFSTKQIAQELGVKYILEGSVQRAGDRVRITAQLIDATTDYHMWSETYDRELKDIFALQDEITIKLIKAMQEKLTYGEQAKFWVDIMPKQLKAYDALMKGNEAFFKFNSRDNALARKFYKQSIDIDPSASMPHMLISFSHLQDLVYGWSDSPIESFGKAEKSAETAYSINDNIDLVHGLLGWIYLYKRMHDRAVEYGKKAIKINPNGAEAHAIVAFIMSFSGKPDEAVRLMNRAMRLNPIPPSHYYHMIGIAYRNNRQYEESIKICKHSIRMNPIPITPYLTLVSCFSFLDRIEEAKANVHKILEISPDFSLKHYSGTLPYKEQSDLERHMNALRKAGLPE